MTPPATVTVGVALPAPTSAAAVAELVGGVLDGDDRPIALLAPLDRAGPDALAFHDKGDPGAAGVLLSRLPIPGRTVVVVADPLAAMIAVVDALLPETPAAGPAHVHPTARVDPSAVLGAGVVVGADCVVGAGTVLFPNVVLYPRTRVGARCRVHAGTVLGADGFRFHPSARGLLKVPHAGGVRVGDDVEIGANCTVDRGFLGDTVLGDGCKLDDQVHVGHNVELGKYVVIAAQTGISGSCRVGDGALLGGQVGVADHASIGAGARIGAQSGVHGEIPAGEAWLGTPAAPLARMRRVYAALRYLPDLVRRSGRA